MLLLACDLDNTLLHSKRHRAGNDVCVERIHDEPWGYMTPGTLQLLAGLPQGVALVPVTTRSVDQYRRIRWPQGRAPELAVTTNGGVLLRGGEPDRGWDRISRAAAMPFLGEMERMAALLESEGLYIRVRIVDGLYLFAYTADGVDIAACARRLRPLTPMTIEASGRKLYFLPPCFTKGAAVMRLKVLLGPARIAAAGDSGIDLSMLDAADVAIVPGADLARRTRCPDVRVCPPDTSFAEFTLREAAALAAAMEQGPPRTGTPARE